MLPTVAVWPSRVEPGRGGGKELLRDGSKRVGMSRRRRRASPTLLFVTCMYVRPPNPSHRLPAFAYCTANAGPSCHASRRLEPLLPLPLLPPPSFTTSPCNTEAYRDHYSRSAFDASWFSFLQFSQGLTLPLLLAFGGRHPLPHQNPYHCPANCILFDSHYLLETPAA